MDIGAEVAKLLWREYRTKNPTLTEEEIFILIFKEMAKEVGKQKEFFENLNE